jgi:type I restriction enzyme R subunit
VDQSIQQDFAPLEKTIHKINFAKDDPPPLLHMRYIFSLYQQLTDRDMTAKTMKLSVALLPFQA